MYGPSSGRRMRRVFKDGLQLGFAQTSIPSLRFTRSISRPGMSIIIPAWGMDILGIDKLMAYINKNPG
jgi:hypothetical protein